MEGEWIQYYPRGDNPVEMPTSGFVEYTDTFFGDERKYMANMSIRSSGDIIWNRAAPSCVAKFRFISEETYLRELIKYIEKKIEEEHTKIKNYQEEVKNHLIRLSELNNDK